MVRVLSSKPLCTPARAQEMLHMATRYPEEGLKSSRSPSRRKNLWRLTMELLETQILNLFKSPIKARNEVIDALSYDVGSFSLDEKTGLSPLSDLKGTVIVV